jgi:membrane-associated phospholipid phosphatase
LWDNRVTDNAILRADTARLFVGGGLILTVLMSVYASTVGTFPGDTRISHAIQAVDAVGAGSIVWFLNSAFDAPTLISITAVVSIVLGILGRYPQMILLAATILSHAANAGLKLVVGRPRPEDGVIRVTEDASGLSFPSGHMMGTVVFFGIIIYLSFQLIEHRLLRFLVQALAISQMLAIGFSRIYTGAHWPSDVLGGFLWGAWFILLLVVCYRWLSSRFAGPPASV